MIKLSREQSKNVHDSMERMAEELDKLEPIQKFTRLSSAVREWQSKYNEELKKRGYEGDRDVTDDNVFLEVLQAVGPMPDADNI